MGCVGSSEGQGLVGWAEISRLRLLFRVIQESMQRAQPETAARRWYRTGGWALRCAQERTAVVLPIRHWLRCTQGSTVRVRKSGFFLWRASESQKEVRIAPAPEDLE